MHLEPETPIDKWLAINCMIPFKSFHEKMVGNHHFHPLSQLVGFRVPGRNLEMVNIARNVEFIIS